MRRGTTQSAVRAAFVFGAIGLCAGCRPKFEFVESVPELGYPSCGDAPLGPPVKLFETSLRPSPVYRTTDTVERYELSRRDCLTIGTLRVERGFDAVDVEVVYDAEGLPLRAWRRVTVPDVPASDGDPDIRRYELRTDEVTVKRRLPGGETTYKILHGGRPRAVIGDGRSMLTAWIQRLHLAEGERVREWVLDLSRAEKVDEVTVVRHADMERAELGGRVRVYTVYGRDPFFANDEDVVIGDMAGMLRADLVRAPMPRPMPRYGGIDPMHTP